MWKSLVNQFSGILDNLNEDQQTNGREEQKGYRVNDQGQGGNPFDVDDDLSILQQIENYQSGKITQRLYLARQLPNHFLKLGYVDSLQYLIPIFQTLSIDPSENVRQTFVEQLAQVCGFLLSDASKAACKAVEQNTSALPVATGEEIVQFMIFPIISKLLKDPDRGVRIATIETIIHLSQHLSTSQQESQLFPIIIELSNTNSLDAKLQTLQLIKFLTPNIGSDLSLKHFIPIITRLAQDSNIIIKKWIGAEIGDISKNIFDNTLSSSPASNSSTTNKESRAVQPQFQNGVLPMYMTLARDPSWRIRKSCTRSLSSISELTAAQDQQTLLLPLFRSFMTDNSKWVRYSMYQNIGYFFNTLPRNLISDDLLMFYTNMMRDVKAFQGSISNNNNGFSSSSVGTPNMLSPDLFVLSKEDNTEGLNSPDSKGDDVDGLFKTEIMNNLPLSPSLLVGAFGNPDNLNNGNGDNDEEDDDEDHNSYNEMRNGGNDLPMSPGLGRFTPGGWPGGLGGAFNRVMRAGGLGGDSRSYHSGKENEIATFCAFHFPAVVYAVGPTKWDLLRDTFVELAHHKEESVRKPIASSLHEVAKILASHPNDLGSHYIHQDIVPLLEHFLWEYAKPENNFVNNMNSNGLNGNEGRLDGGNEGLGRKRIKKTPEAYGVMKGIGEMIKYVESRNEMIQDLCLIGNEGSNWRMRKLLARALGTISFSFELEQLEDWILPISIQLCFDVVSVVRLWAAQSVAKIIYRLRLLSIRTTTANNQNNSNNSNKTRATKNKIKQVKKDYEEQVLRIGAMSSCQDRAVFLDITSGLLSLDLEEEEGQRSEQGEGEEQGGGEEKIVGKYVKHVVEEMLGDRVPNMRVKIVEIMRKVGECRKKGLGTKDGIQYDKWQCKSALDVLIHDRDVEVKRLAIEALTLY
eukprot:TRINITY_DN18220_c0_g1_i3.p1 TRINITY_DN18220_c0_g1~~TRINITY_DN18220_c0_g1_i3.p1  ORF type:complete len:914 (+),score=249.38 TRINITY_DN18220_c0_g1_i3:105-2846(+)